MIISSIAVFTKVVLLVLGVSSAFNYYDISSKNQVKHGERFESEKHKTLKHFEYLNLNQSAQEKLAPALVAVRKITEVDFETIKDRFDVEGNSDLEKAKIVLFSETHSSPEVITNNFQMLAKLVQPGDIILWETPEKQADLANTLLKKLLSAQYPSAFNQTQQENSIESFKRLQSQVQESDWPFSGVHLLGWDLKLKKSEPNRDSLIELAMEPVVFMGDLLIRRDAHLKNRNSVLEDIFSKLRCKKIFVIAGADHIPTGQSKEKPNIAGSISDMQRILQPYQHAMLTLKDYRAIADQKTDFQDEYRALIGIIPGIMVLIALLPAATPDPAKTLAFISRTMILVYSAASINTIPILAVFVQGFQALPDQFHSGMAILGISYKLLGAIKAALINYGPADTLHLNEYCLEPSN